MLGISGVKAETVTVTTESALWDANSNGTWTSYTSANWGTTWQSANGKVCVSSAKSGYINRKVSQIADTDVTIWTPDGNVMITGYSITFKSHAAENSVIKGAAKSVTSTGTDDEQTFAVTGLYSHNAKFNVDVTRTNQADIVSFTITYETLPAQTAEAYYIIKNPWDGTKDFYLLAQPAVNESKMYKKTVTGDDVAKLGANSNYVWKITSYGDYRVILNVGTGRYVSNFNAADLTSASKDGSAVNILSTTSIDDSEVFTVTDRSSIITDAIAFRANSKSVNCWLNCYNSTDGGAVGFHSASHEGDRMLLSRVYKVTFQEEDGERSFVRYAGPGFNDIVPEGLTFKVDDVTKTSDELKTIFATLAADITVTYDYIPQQITDASQISSNKVYRLRTDRTAIYAASSSATAASATSSAASSTLSVKDALNQWAFVEKNSKKYLYNVGAKKFLKTSPYVDFNTAEYGKWDNTHNFLESYSTHEIQVSAYTDIENRFWLKDAGRTPARVFNSGDGSFTINGWTSSDGDSNTGNGWIIEEIPTIVFDPTEALAALDNSISYLFRKVDGDTDENLTSSDEQRDVASGSSLSIGYEEGYYSPILKLKDIKVNGVSKEVGSIAITDGDDISWIYKCPFNVSDEPTAGEWAANTYWHFLDIHTSSHKYLNIPADFNYANVIPANTTTKSYDDGFLWCITGDNTTGYRLYNKRAGATKVMTFTSGTGAFMSDLSGNEAASLLTMAHSTWHVEGYTTGAPTFVFPEASARPNLQDNAVKSWGYSDKGSEFTFEPVEEVILNEMEDNYAPYFTQWIGYVGGLSWDGASLTGDLAEEYATVYAAPTIAGLETFITHFNENIVEAVENAKYYIISAYPEYQKQQSVRKALYYDSGAGIFKWKTYDSADDAFVFQLRKTGDNWNIYNPSAGKYMKDCQGTNNTSDDPNTFTFSDLGFAQWNIKDSSPGTLHTAGHSSGAGNAGNITRWNGGLNSASSWYIAPVVETVSAISPAAVAADADVYQTFANPYDCQVVNAEVYYITAQTASTAHVEKATSEIIPANTGVILKAKKGATISIRPLSVAYDTNLTNNNILIAGNGSTTVTEGNFMLAYSSTDEIGKFYAIGAGGYIVPANKAYLPAFAGVKSLVLSFDEETGIQSIENEQSTLNGDIYNIAGQRVNKATKGLYIINGKKVVIK